MRSLFFLLLIIALPSTAAAHSDPLGEINPKIHVEDGRFAVYFTDNREAKAEVVKGRPNEVGDSIAYYRMTVAPTGEVLKLREPAQRPPDPKLPIEMEGFNKPIINEHDNKFYAFPRASMDHGGQPFMYELGSNRIAKIRFWSGNDRVEGVHSALVSENALAIVGTPESDIPMEKRGSDFRFGPFSLYIFNHVETGDGFPWIKCVHQKIGLPAYIYSFPIASELLFDGRYYYLAWIEDAGEQSPLKLTRWGPVPVSSADSLCNGVDDDRIGDKTITLEKSSASDSVEMARIDSNLLVAVEESGRIKLIHINLSKRFEETEH